jgi:protein-disulfide isomerase
MAHEDAEHEAILEELRELRAKVERLEQSLTGTTNLQAPAQQAERETEVRVSTSGRYVLGKDDAPVTLVEFTDYQCPYCNQFFFMTRPKLKSDYIDAGILRLVIKDLPLPIHPDARRAAHAARCGGEQDAFWRIQEMLYSNARQFNDSLLDQYLTALDLDKEDFGECMDSGRHYQAIDRDMFEARGAGIRSTPSFVLGRTDGDVLEGKKIRGAQPYEVFSAEIESILSQP